ncbi:MAG TPA: S1 RNA-binding domain-containing protein, partial [Acidimicrobiales bacterium]|nr:S1 RNA-binding domain-containing protein [Acidimicrobiales bacterium]
ALQQETGADIAVDDDGMVGTVTIGAKDGTAVEEARRRISTILDPPLAEVGAIYPGKVVNITKFGAFVNILPGRDGLLHISKIGQGKRVERVEDVLELGQSVEVKVDDIDPQGKVSLSLAGDPPASDASGGTDRVARGDGGGREGSGRNRPRGDHADPGERSDRGRRPAEKGPAPASAPSFEEAFEVELVQEFGDLGPAVAESSDRPGGGGGGGRGGRRRR